MLLVEAGPHGAFSDREAHIFLGVLYHATSQEESFQHTPPITEETCLKSEHLLQWVNSTKQCTLQILVDTTASLGYIRSPCDQTLRYT